MAIWGSSQKVDKVTSGDLNPAFSGIMDKITSGCFTLLASRVPNLGGVATAPPRSEVSPPKRTKSEFHAPHLPSQGLELGGMATTALSVTQKRGALVGPSELDHVCQLMYYLHGMYLAVLSAHMEQKSPVIGTQVQVSRSLG